MGIFRDVDRPVYDELMAQQLEEAAVRGVGEDRDAELDCHAVQPIVKMAR